MYHRIRCFMFSSLEQGEKVKKVVQEKKQNLEDESEGILDKLIDAADYLKDSVLGNLLDNLINRLRTRMSSSLSLFRSYWSGIKTYSGCG